jgi:FKBP-type peptidyl-prolyl cis-trans isomerase SlyD
MMIQKDKVVAISYELRVNSQDGELLEQVETGNPLQFVYGTGYMLPEFEKNIAGLNIGDSFDFSLDPDQAYGLVDENAIVDLSKEIFMVDGNLRDDLLVVGNTIPMRDNQGNRLDGIVLEVSDENVKLDFNHPMAGDTLFFKGSIVEVREATEEELEHGHVHHEHHDCHGCSHCG